MWCELHDSSRDHPKIIKLSRDCNVTRAHALGLMCSLWTWTLRMAPDGDLSSFDDEDIEIGAGWEGEPGKFIAACAKYRLLDRTEYGLSVHDWAYFSGSLKSASRAKECRKRKRENVTVTLQSRDGAVLSRDITQTDRQTDRQTHTTDRQTDSDAHVTVLNTGDAFATMNTWGGRWIPAIRSKPEADRIAKELTPFTMDELLAAKADAEKLGGNLSFMLLLTRVKYMRGRARDAPKADRVGYHQGSKEFGEGDQSL